MAEVREAAVSASPDELLRTAYPRRWRRARAVPWLSWIAMESLGQGSFGWWYVPLWLGEDKLLWPRRLLTTALFWATFGFGLGAYNGAQVGAPLGFTLAIGAGWASGALGYGSLLDRELRVLAPRPPRGAREARDLAIGVVSGVLLRRVVIRQWRRVITDGTPDSAYRACVRSALVDAAVCLMAGLPLTVVALFGGWPGLLVPAGLVTGFAMLGALCGEPLPEVWLASIAKPPHRRRWNFLLRLGSSRRLFRDAERGGLLRTYGNEYLFASAEIRDYLIGLEQAVIDERARRKALARERAAARKERYAQAAASAGAGPRTWLLRLLSEPACGRLSIWLSIGVAAGFWVGYMLQPPGADVWAVAGAVVLLGGWSAFMGVFLLRVLLAILGGLLRWSLWLTGRMSARARTSVAAGIVCAAGLITLAAGPAGMRHALAVAGVGVLPGAVVAVVGGWGACLVHQHWRDSKRLPLGRIPLIRRIARIRQVSLVALVGDALGAFVACVTVLLWYDPALLGAQAAAALLFPLAVWFSIRAWRAMSSSERVPVRAAADITVSLLLGASLTGLLVCLANVLKMPSAEVTVLRGAADHVGGLLDIPWWIWTSAYVVLAALGLAFVRWPDRLRRVSDWLSEHKVVPGAEILRRGTAGAHIGLLLIALAGAAVPAAIGPVLRFRLGAQYTQTLTDTARADGAAAELRLVASEAGLFRDSLLIPLAELVEDIHHDCEQPAGRQDASSVELDLAQRLGALQAVTLAAPANRPPVEQTEARVTEAAGLDASGGNAGADARQLGELAKAEHEDDEAKEQAEQAGELAASALAKALGPLPGLGQGEVAGILKEYLSALIEFSPLKDTFAAWAGKLGTSAEPPEVTHLVVPDPVKLKKAAAAQASQEIAKTPVSDPAKVKALLAEGGIAGAVSLVNQTRYLEENGAGPCEGCSQSESSTDNGGPDHPDEPVDVP
jgi:hypothetical protein